MHTATIIGGPVSPYARKVMAIADIKGVRWRADPIIPFQGNDEFTRISPLRRIPVYIDDQVTLADSTAIGEYLDERYPTPPLFPAGPAARARARWLEEFADTRMGDVFIWRIFNPAVIVPGVWKQPSGDRRDASRRIAIRPGLSGVRRTRGRLRLRRAGYCRHRHRGAFRQPALVAHGSRSGCLATDRGLDRPGRTGPGGSTSDHVGRAGNGHARRRTTGALRRDGHSADRDQLRRQRAAQGPDECLTGAMADRH